MAADRRWGSERETYAGSRSRGCCLPGGAVMATRATILCTGDIHMGRRPGGLPSQYQEAASATETWRHIVNFALEHGPDVVLLTGDIVDQQNRYYEALGPLEAGIRKLGDAGIKVLAVSGNHDFDVLPRLADNLDPETFQLLGVGGEWERAVVERDGEPILHVDGWSYPARRPRRDPLETYELAPAEDAPVIGMVHAQLDHGTSPYARVRLDDLQATPVAAWCLGHEHVPRPYSAPGKATVLNPGSPQGLDPTETGKHGPWMLTISEGGAIEVEQHGLANARFEGITLSADGLDGPPQVESALLQRMTEALEQALDENTSLRALSVRVRIEGRTAAHGELASRVEEMVEGLAPEREGVPALIERIELATRPPIDLEALAQGDDPVGVVASRIIAWSDADTSPDQMPLVRGAVERMRALAAAKPYKVLRTVEDHQEPTAEDARQLLIRQGYALIEQMQRDKEGSA